MNVPEIIIYPDSQEQYDWINKVIEKGMDAFSKNPLEATVYAFRLLEQEADLQTESLRKVRQR